MAITPEQIALVCNAPRLGFDADAWRAQYEEFGDLKWLYLNPAYEVQMYGHIFSAEVRAAAAAIIAEDEEMIEETRAAYVDESNALMSSMDSFTKGYIGAVVQLDVELRYGDERSDQSKADGVAIIEVRPDALRDLMADCATFQEKNAALLEEAYEAGLDPEQAGNDYYLDRVGHGAGAKDRDMGVIGERLYKAAIADRAEVNLAIYEDGSVGMM